MLALAFRAARMADAVPVAVETGVKSVPAVTTYPPRPTTRLSAPPEKVAPPTVMDAVLTDRPMELQNVPEEAQATVTVLLRRLEVNPGIPAKRAAIEAAVFVEVVPRDQLPDAFMV